MQTYPKEVFRETYVGIRFEKIVLLEQFDQKMTKKTKKNNFIHTFPIKYYKITIANFSKRKK